MTDHSSTLGPLRQVGPATWEIPQGYKPVMREQIVRDQALDQVANVATLPGIVGASLAMPDIHWGYGFPVGGVAAMRADEGVISPGGIGYDINCGVRLVATKMATDEVKGKLDRLADVLYKTVPAGTGDKSDIKLSGKRGLDVVMRGGARWAVEAGYGLPEDVERIEEGGGLGGGGPPGISPG